MLACPLCLFASFLLATNNKNRKTVNTLSINCTQSYLTHFAAATAASVASLALLHAAVELAVRTADKQSRPVVGAGCVDSLQLDVLAPAKPQKAAATAAVAGGRWQVAAIDGFECKDYLALGMLCDSERG